MESLRAHKKSLSDTDNNQIGAKLLLSGQELAMWFWQAMPTTAPEVETYVSQDYEVMGYVLSGLMELHVDGKVISLEPGDSWVVPTGALHAYCILEPLTALKTSHPPAGQIY